MIPKLAQWQVLAVAVAALPIAAPVAAQPSKVKVEKPTAVAIQPQILATEKLEVQKVDDEHEVDLKQVPAAQFKMLDAGSVRNLQAGTDRVQLRPDQLLTRRLPTKPRKLDMAAEGVEGKEQWALPYQILGVDAEGEAFELQPLIEIDGGGMRPRSGGGFSGRLFAAVRDARRPEEVRTLGTPIEMLITADVDAVQPNTLSIGQTNHFVPVELSAASPSDPVNVRLVPSFDLEGTDLAVPVLRGTLSLSISPARIQGLGLETARITVEATGVPNPDGFVVALSSDGASPEEGRLMLDAAGGASTRIRSVTTGVATVRASSPGLQPGEARVTFAFPWLFLVAALLGGGVGGIIRRAAGGSPPAGDESKPRRSVWVDVLVLGGLAGLVVAAAYSVGINLLGFQPSAHAGEALVFVLAALGAYVGIPRSSGSASAAAL